jgi:hypothetical protein
MTEGKIHTYDQRTTNAYSIRGKRKVKAKQRKAKKKVKRRAK